MAKSRKALPTLLYFYQKQLTQEEVERVEEHFADKQVHFRRVFDINDTRDITERCAYAAGTVPLIYSIRKSEGVLTDGILADPLEQVNAAKATSKGKDTDVAVVRQNVMSTGHTQPTDANIAAKLIKEEVEAATAKKATPDVKPVDIKVDTTAAEVSSVTGQIQTPVAPVAPTTPAAPVAPAVPAADQKADNK